MFSSFTTGYAKLAANADPRVVVLYGDEAALKQKIEALIYSRKYEFETYTDGPVDIFCSVESLRQSRKRHITIDASKVQGWDWLPASLNKVPSTRMLVHTDSHKVASLLQATTKSRGLVVHCTAPTGVAGRNKLVEVFKSWYGFSTSQILVFLNKYHWKLTPCIQAMDKLALLGIELTSTTAQLIDVCENPLDSFVWALQNQKRPLALKSLLKMSPDSYQDAVYTLSRWLDDVAQVKLSRGFMKPVREVALELGKSPRVVEELFKHTGRYDLNAISRATLSLANADSALSKGCVDGVMELLVETW